MREGRRQGGGDIEIVYRKTDNRSSKGTGNKGTQIQQNDEQKLFIDRLKEYPRKENEIKKRMIDK